MESLLFILAGGTLGTLAAWFIAKYKFEGQNGLKPSEVEAKYVTKEIYVQTKEELDKNAKDLVLLNTSLAKAEQENIHLQEKLTDQKQVLEKTQAQFRIEFENLANRLLEEKSKKFVEINEKKVDDILRPLKEKIQNFEKKVDENYKEETRERISLKKELERIVELNRQVSEDADRLTKALKGDTKTQGNWGEIQLELILEKAGLHKDVHYLKQESFKNEEGKQQRPDYIINLPDNKNLVLDAKVSITAYESYFNSDDEKEQKKYLVDHLASIQKHIKDLSSRNYQSLYEINQPDYVLMFIPVESALTLALREDLQLFEKALDKNIVLVSTSTLLATLRTISYIWKQENQRKNVFEIARESGKLYDKFVGFMEDLVGVGRKLEDAKESYSHAMNKLIKSSKKGDTIVGRIERIKTLGADATKALPQKILDKIEDSDETLKESDKNTSLTIS